MTYFNYKEDELFVEKTPIASIAESVGTPFFCYSNTALIKQYDFIRKILSPLGVNICYAIKANSNQAVIKTFAKQGCGADIVSQGELLRALDAGIPADRIIFSGVGKTTDEIRYALEKKIGQFNVESLPELENISAIAREMGVQAPISLRINPDIDARTHEKITTGRKADKFGIDFDIAPEIYARASSSPSIKALGIAIHIGSQLTSLEPFSNAFAKLRTLVKRLRTDGLSVSQIDLGGGLGVVYTDEIAPDLKSYAKLIKDNLIDLDLEIHVEPGRMLVANAGVLVTRVIYIKDTPLRRFVIVDAAMNDLIRPTLYDAIHDVMCVRHFTGRPKTPVQIVGPVCETGDILVKEIRLPELRAGELIAICSAGAYGAVMGSTYNTRLPTPEVMVKEFEFSIVRARPLYKELISLDLIPEWV